MIMSIQHIKMCGLQKAESRGKCLALYASIGKAERPKAYPLRSKGNKLDLNHKIIRRKEKKTSKGM